MGTTHTLAFLRTLWPFNNLRMPEYYDVLARSHRSLVRYSFFFYFVLKLLSTNFIFNVWLVNTKLLIFFQISFSFFFHKKLLHWTYHLNWGGVFAHWRSEFSIFQYGCEIGILWPIFFKFHTNVALCHYPVGVFFRYTLIGIRRWQQNSWPFLLTRIFADNVTMNLIK